MIGAPKNLGLDPFPDSVGHFGFCRWWIVAGGEQMPPALLGMYFKIQTFISTNSSFACILWRADGQIGYVLDFVFQIPYWLGNVNPVQTLYTNQWSDWSQDNCTLTGKLGIHNKKIDWIFLWPWYVTKIYFVLVAEQLNTQCCQCVSSILAMLA